MTRFTPQLVLTATITLFLAGSAGMADEPTLEQASAVTPILEQSADENAAPEQPIDLANWQPEQEPVEYFNFEELQAEMKKLAWTKNDVKIVPYARLWGSVAYDTERTTPRRFALWTYAPEQEGESQFVIDTRRTRLGINVQGPEVELFDCTPFTGVVEIDFFGQFLTENQPDVRLRHAYGEFKNENYRVLAGQTWDLISPRLPNTINFPVGWAVGNIGFRRMQIRYERYLHPTDDRTIEVGVALADTVIQDLVEQTGIDRETSDWPLIQGRVGIKQAGLTKSCDPIELGVSGHIGEQGFDFGPLSPPPQDDLRVLSWSFNVDARVPLTDSMGVHGEFFMGKDLATFLGGIVQGVDATRRDGVHSIGGWVEGWYDLTDKWHSHLGYSLDDPRNQDLTTASARTFNSSIYANTTYDITKNLNVGVELSFWTTRYLGLSTGNATRVEFAGMYKY